MPPRCQVLVPQLFSSAHQRYGVPVGLCEQHIIRHEVVDAEDELTAALGDAAAEFLARWLTHTPQDESFRRHFWEERCHGVLRMVTGLLSGPAQHHPG